VGDAWGKLLWFWCGVVRINQAETLPAVPD